jgi:Flp pilus assembly pilin Flp
MTRSARRDLTLRAIARYFAEENGATSIEYGIIASLISIAIVGTVYSLGDAIKDNLYNKIGNALSSM